LREAAEQFRFLQITLGSFRFIIINVNINIITT